MPIQTRVITGVSDDSYDPDAAQGASNITQTDTTTTVTNETETGSILLEN